MIEIIAQIPTGTTQELGLWVSVGAGALAIAALVKTVFVRKPPLEREFVSQDFCREAHAKADESMEKFKDQTDDRFVELRLMIQREIKEMDKKSEERSVALHSRINPIEKTLSRIEALLEERHGKK